MKRYFLLLLVFFLSVLCSAQELDNNSSVKPLPKGYRSYQMGMSLDAVKQTLLKDPYFRYRGDPDVSMLATEQQYMIQCEGGGFIQDAVFQFYKDGLISITLVLDPGRIDHYTIFSTLISKYGAPGDLSPVRSVWTSDNLSMTLEKPLTVKYLDLQAFQEILDSSQKEESYKEILREDFLEQF